SPGAHAARRQAHRDPLHPGPPLQCERRDDVRAQEPFLPKRARRLLVRHGERADGARARRRAERVEHQHGLPRRNPERRAGILAGDGARVLRKRRRDRALQPRLDRDPAVPRRKRRLGRGARAGPEAQARRRDRPATRGAVTLERGATIDTLRLRAAMLDRVRAFFAARGVLEVETASLSPAAPTDPALESIAAHVERLGGARYLHTSPEFAMKRLLADGIGDIYQLCRVYRDGEIGRWHQPEFTMLEWYRLAFDDAQ